MLKSRLIGELRKRSGELFELCSQMIQIPSENPPGDTTKLGAFIRDHLESRRIPVEWHEPMAGRPNLVATIGSGSPNLVLSGHLDEFPAGQGWTRPPFSGAIEAGRIWGRGAGDMKAGLAVALTVASLVRELDAQWLLGNVAAVRGDACLIGESSGTWSAGIGEKGVLWLRLTASGVSGHAAYQQGVSAVSAIRSALAVVERMHGRKARGDEAVARVIARQRVAAERRWGRGTGRLPDTLAVSVGTLRGGGQVNLIPESAMAEVDVRVPPGLTTAAVEKEARRRIRQKARSSVIVDVFNRCDPYVTRPDAPLVKLVLANAKTLNRRTVLPVVRLGYTDGRFFRRAGIPTVVYGPAVHNMGGPDEYIETTDLLEAAVAHAGTVVDMLAPGAA